MPFSRKNFEIFVRIFKEVLTKAIFFDIMRKKGGTQMGKFVIKKTPTGAFNFSLYAANQEKIAVASQVYTTKAACKKGMESIGKHAVKCIADGCGPPPRASGKGFARHGAKAPQGCFWRQATCFIISREPNTCCIFCSPRQLPMSHPT